jgi:hypothetical protein
MPVVMNNEGNGCAEAKENNDIQFVLDPEPVAVVVVDPSAEHAVHDELPTKKGGKNGKITRVWSADVQLFTK